MPDITRYPVFSKDHALTKSLFKSTAARRNKDREYREGPIETYRDIMSNDPRLLKVKEGCSIEMSALGQDVGPNGEVHGNGIANDFYGLRHVSGFPMQNATIPMADNRHMRETLDLANRPIKPWHEMMFRAFVRLMFTGLDPCPLQTRIGRSSCGPYFDTDVVSRISMAHDYLGTAKQAGELALAGRHGEAFDHFDLGGYYYAVYRSQTTDSVKLENGKFVPKQRLVADMEYAVTGGRSGVRQAADKSMSGVDFWCPDGFFRERRRTAQGGPWGTNSRLIPIFASVRKRMYSEFEYTFHHTTRSQREGKLRAMQKIMAVDVSDHDVLWFTFLLDIWKDELLNLGYPDWWVEIFHTSLHLPIYVSTPGPGVGQFLIGDPRNPNLHPGMSSGHAGTDILGAGGMSVVYAISQIENTAPFLERLFTSQKAVDHWLASYYKGKEPICQMNKGDDAVLGWRDGQACGSVDTYRDKMTRDVPVSPYMKVGLESTNGFLGDLFLYPQSLDHSELILIGNINSMLRNDLSPEYGVDSGIKDRARRRRPFPGLGYETRPQTYGTCPAYQDVTEILEREWRNNFNESYHAFKTDALNRDKKALIRYASEAADRQKQKFRNWDLTNLTAIEVEVICDPDKLAWKYLTTDVRPEIASLSYNGLGLEYVEPYFNEVMKNVHYN